MTKKKAAAPALAPVAPHRLLTADEVVLLCRFSRGQLDKLEHANRFPKRKRYGFRRVAWSSREVDEWIAIGAEAWVREHAEAQAA